MDDAEALSVIIGVLKQLELDVQKRVLRSVHAFLEIESSQSNSISIANIPEPNASPDSRRFSRDRTLSAKDFIRDKNPQTDVDRVACLAYYLAHYRDSPHFKTVDISALNTEAAQPKFSNAAAAVDNARAGGYLVPATKGNKQISAAGEKFVELLPDRVAAKEALLSLIRRNSKRSKNSSVK